MARENPVIFVTPDVDELRHALHLMPGDGYATSTAGQRTDLSPCVFVHIDDRSWRIDPADAVRLAALLGAGERGARLRLAQRIALSACIAFCRQVEESRLPAPGAAPEQAAA